MTSAKRMARFDNRVIHPIQTIYRNDLLMCVCQKCIPIIIIISSSSSSSSSSSTVIIIIITFRCFTQNIQCIVLALKQVRFILLDDDTSYSKNVFKRQNNISPLGTQSNNASFKANAIQAETSRASSDEPLKRSVSTIHHLRTSI